MIHRAVRFIAVIVAAVAMIVPATAAHAGGPMHYTWRLVALPDPHGDPIAGYDVALDCPGAATCVIVGAHTYLTRLFGHDARTVVAPVYENDPGFASALVDVSCSTRGECVATGEYDQGPCCGSFGYRDVLDGGTWTAQDNGSAAWQDIACNVDRCVEVGTGDAGVEFAAIDDQIAGGQWTRRQIVTPWRDDGFYTTVDSVTCPQSGGNCFAVGRGTSADRSMGGPLLFSRDGDVWRGVVEALPAGADAIRSAGVHALSCPSPGNCLGLGTYVDASTGQTELFAEMLSEGSLSARAVPTPAALTDISLARASLSCATETSCAGTVGSVLLRFYAGRWNEHFARLPADAAAGSPVYLNDVSCATPTLCVAVGDYLVTSGRFRAAAWTRNGGQWRVQSLGTPRGIDVAPDDDVMAKQVRCALSRCTVVGAAAGELYFGIGRLVG